MTDPSIDALFMALANAQEARRCARAMRSRASTTPPISPTDLITALQLINKLVKDLGATSRAYAQALNRARDQSDFPVSAIAYDAAREVLFLSRRLSRGAPIANSVSATTALDIALHKKKHTPTD